MLVCNVSQRARRASIAADIAEITLAVDAAATGNVVFATLVDDPASVGDHVDAYLGEIMREAASAAATVTAGLAYAAAIAEAVTVTEAWSGSVPAVGVMRSAMLAGPIFVNNPGASRTGNVDGIMVNL